MCRMGIPASRSPRLAFVKKGDPSAFRPGWAHRFALSLLLSLGLARGTKAQLDPALTTELSAAVRPIRLVTGLNAVADLRPLKDLVGQRRVVALGESTHGAHEPLALRNHLFQLMVAESGFTAIALETGFSESKAIQRYIDGGPGDACKLVRQQMTWGFGGFPENLALVEWMRAYNADPAHGRKLRFYGIDLSGAGDGAFPRARRAVDDVLDTLATRDTEAAKVFRLDLEPILTRFSSSRYSELSAEERRKLMHGLDHLTHALKARRDGLPSGNNAELVELSWALQSVEVARQLERMFALSPVESGSGPGIPPEAWRAMEARDLGMAENVRWALQAEGLNGKLLVFAHNNHVMDAKIAGGIWSTLKQPPASMGLFLRRFYGEDICLTGTSAAAASGGFSSFKINPRSWDAAFAGIAASQFVLPTRSPQINGGVARWLNEARPLHANLATEVMVAVGQAFDAVVFLREFTPSRTH
jgi:erythromycin esterase